MRSSISIYDLAAIRIAWVSGWTNADIRMQWGFDDFLIRQLTRELQRGDLNKQAKFIWHTIDMDLYSTAIDRNESYWSAQDISREQIDVLLCASMGQDIKMLSQEECHHINQRRKTAEAQQLYGRYLSALGMSVGSVVNDR